MANQVRLIDANAFRIPKGFFNDGINVPKILGLVAKQPTVDAVAVVRCKDCKHYFHFGDDVYGCRTYGMMKTNPDGFCSLGKRRQNNV